MTDLEMGGDKTLPEETQPLLEVNTQSILEVETQELLEAETQSLLDSASPSYYPIDAAIGGKDDTTLDAEQAAQIKTQMKMIRSTERFVELWYQMEPMRSQYRRTVTGLMAVLFTFTMLVFVMEKCLDLLLQDVFGYGIVIIGGIMLLWTIASLGYACKACHKAGINNVLLFMPLYLESMLLAKLIIIYGSITIAFGFKTGIYVLVGINGLLLFRAIFINVYQGLLTSVIHLLLFLGLFTTSDYFRHTIGSSYWKYLSMVYSLMPIIVASLLLAIRYAVLLHHLSRGDVDTIKRPTDATPKKSARRIMVRKRSPEEEEEKLIEDRTVQQAMEVNYRDRCILSILASRFCNSQRLVCYAGILGSIVLAVAITSYGVKKDIRALLMLHSWESVIVPFYRVSKHCYNINQWILGISSITAIVLLSFPFGYTAGLIFEAIGFDFMNLANKSNVVYLRPPTYKIGNEHVTLDKRFMRHLARAQL